jgi:Helix-hairpin-helix motif
LGDLVNTGAMVPSGPTRTRLGFGITLWALIPLLSLGLLAPVPFAHAAVRLRQRSMWAVTAAYAIGSLLWIVAASLPEGDWGDTLLSIVAPVLIAVGTAHAFLLRRRVFAPPPTQPALAAALATRQRRAEARAIASRDTALARQLRIGRPDLSRQFDDGGLVDVNHVPAQVLVDQLGLSPARAGQVVEVRDRLGGFAGPEELTAYTDLSPEAVDGLKEHLVFFAVE